MRLKLVFLLSLVPAVLFAGQFPVATFHGDVVVRNSGERQMVILLDSYGRGDGHDGLVDHAWVVASETPFANGVSIFMRDARVTSEQGRITVYSPADHAAVVFMLAETKDDDRWASSATTITRYRGYGISHYWGEVHVAPITIDGVEQKPPIASDP